MDNLHPPLSIVIPSYKRAHAILPLLQVIANEAGPDDDLVVIDDASGDGIDAIVAQVSAFRLVVHPTNLGMVANWNACFHEARNVWICIVHHDDMVVPGALKAMRRACRIAGGPAAIVHWRAGAAIDSSFRYRSCDPGPWAVLNVPTIPSGAIVHRAIVEKLGGFDPQWKYSSDMEFFPRICREYPLVIIESPSVVRYRLHQDNFQYETWRQPDFESQLEGIEVAVASYAGLGGSEAKAHVRSAMRGLFKHMFFSTLWIDDRNLLKKISRRLLTFSNIGPKTRLFAMMGAVIGWAPKPKRHHLAELDADL